MIQHGAFVWNELLTDDVEKAKTFYATTLGWTYVARPMPHGVYTIAHAGGQPVAGILGMTGIVPDGTPPHWFAYIEVDDIDSRLAGVEAAGGKIMRPAFDIEGVGRIAILADSTGGYIGWMTSKR